MADSSLNSNVSDYHIAEIADELVEWEHLAPYLDLTESEQTVIAKNHRDNYEAQKQQALRKWQKKSGENGTYRNLSSICRSKGLVGLAEKIESLPGSESGPKSTPILNTFQQYLSNAYLTSQHPAIPQWPDSNLLQTPPTFCNVNLHEAPLLEAKSPMDPTQSHKEVRSETLENVLAKGEGSKRMLVYFKGIGGSGKTTLSWHACREWAHNRLLNQFQLLIHVDLTLVKSATTFADIIAYPDSGLQPAIAEAIVDCKGSGVCLLLDGLDDATTEFLDFLLVDLLQGRLGSVQLPELSFVLTSRPDWRVTERLQRVLKSCIVLAGFTRESLFKFLDNSLGAASKENAILLQEFKINPAVEGLCCHPVNAAIMSFVIPFIENSEIPTTQTKLHELLVIHFLIRHVKSREKTDKPCEITCLLDDKCLPQEICPLFRRLCQVAYTATLELKHLFSSENLEQVGIVDTLGLLNTRPTITMYGSKQYYSFYHISVQEFLAAVHLAVMKEDEQVTAIEQFLGNDLVKTHVLPFYAGLTNLSNREAFKAISKPIPQVGQFDYVMTQLAQADTAPMQRAVAVIKCLYESQNESLMQLPETDLISDNFMKQVTSQIARNISTGDSAIGNIFAGDSDIADFFNNHMDNVMKLLNIKCLFLFALVLTPLDCLSLGHYIRAKYLKATSKDEESIPVLHLVFAACSIKEIGMRLLLTEMAKDVTEYSQVIVSLGLQGNQFDSESLLSLKQLLRGPINIMHLFLGNCLDPAIVDLGYALKCITEGLANNPVCQSVDLSFTPFNASHTYHITLMLLTCSELNNLTITFSSFGSEVMSLFGHALALSSINCLGLLACDISDSELDVLGQKLQDNSHLHVLQFGACKLTPAGFCKFLRHFKTSTCSHLQQLTVGSNVAEHPDVQQIVREINVFRSTISHPHGDLVITMLEQFATQIIRTTQLSNIFPSQATNIVEKVFRQASTRNPQ